MVINEKALLRAMKEAYKKNGYNVAKRGTGENAVIILQAEEWDAEITWKNIPSKVLGMIVEHIHILPGHQEAYTAKNGETATTLYSMLDELPELNEEDYWPNVHRCPLNCAGYDVFQTDEKKCELVNPIVSNLLDDYGRKVLLVDDAFYLIGNASKIRIKPKAFNKTKKEYDMAMYLSGKQWW